MLPDEEVEQVKGPEIIVLDDDIQGEAFLAHMPQAETQPINAKVPSQNEQVA